MSAIGPLSARLESVCEEERTRIAREIHDDLGQTLTALKIDLDLLSKWIADANPSSSCRTSRCRT